MKPLPTGLMPDLKVLDDLRAIVFDVYGTLFISESGDRSEGNTKDPGLFLSVLRQAGLQRSSPLSGERAELLFHTEMKHSHTLARENGVEYPEVDIIEIWDKVLFSLVGEGLISKPDSDRKAGICAVYHEILSNPVYPMPHLAETLSYLLSRDLILGIVSNAQFYTPFLFPAFLDKTLPELGFEADLCIWSFRFGRGKPDPLLYRKLRERLRERSVEPHQTLYIGNDLLKDIYPAGCTGFKTGLFAGDLRSLRLREKELCSIPVTSDILFTDLRQITGVIPDTMTE